MPFICQSSMVFKHAKMLSRLHRKTKNGNEEKPLMENTEQADGKQTLENKESSDQCPDPIILNAEVCNEGLRSICRELLNELSNPEETDQFVESVFPSLPVEGPQETQLQHLQEFLKSVQSKCNELRRLTPSLEDNGLLDHLTASYSRHLFTQLDLLLKRDLSVKEIFCLLQWGKGVFFGPEPVQVFRVHDPLLLTEWFDRAMLKLLPKLQNDITRILKNILCYDEKHRHYEDSMDEETFISVYIDVTQCLNAVIQDSKQFSQTLMHRVKKICLDELHHFVQKYVEKHLKKLLPLNSNSVYLFRIICTCRQLRFFAPQLNTPHDDNSNGLSNIIHILQDMEDHVLAVVQKMMKDLAQESLERYFKKGDVDIHDLTDKIKNHCSSLPNSDAGREIQKIFVNLAYDCVSRVYLNCLMKSKLEHLEERWGNVGDRMKEDALSFHSTFTELSASDDQKNQLLQKMSEVLCCKDVNALKITCCTLYTVFPNDSKQYVPGLLHSKRALSKRQVREVMDVIRELHLDPKPRRVTCHPVRCLCCCSYE